MLFTGPATSWLSVLLTLVSAGSLPHLLRQLWSRGSELGQHPGLAWQRFDQLIYGFGAYLALDLWLSHKPRSRLRPTLDFLKVFVHELLHTVVAILCLNRMVSFNAGQQEGEVRYQGQANSLITLAPYFLPLFTLLLLVLRGWLSRPALSTVDLMIGFSYGFHLLTFWQQLSPQQPDIRAAGIIPSYIIVICMNLIFLGVFLIVPSRGWQHFWQWLQLPW